MCVSAKAEKSGQVNTGERNQGWIVNNPSAQKIVLARE
jgi:hypothetical protein